MEVDKISQQEKEDRLKSVTGDLGQMDDFLTRRKETFTDISK